MNVEKGMFNLYTNNKLWSRHYVDILASVDETISKLIKRVEELNASYYKRTVRKRFKYRWKCDEEYLVEIFF